MTLDPATLLAIAGMAIVTYINRLSGLVLVRFVRLEGRTKAALDALPPAILMAVIAPMALARGPAETAAAIITVIAALPDRPHRVMTCRTGGSRSKAGVATVSPGSSADARRRSKSTASSLPLSCRTRRFSSPTTPRASRRI